MNLNLSPEQVALLIAAADAPEGSPVRQQLAATLGPFEPFPQRHWTQFPIRSVIALLLWAANQEQKAVQIAVQSVAASGMDEVALNVIQAARRKLYDSAMWAAHYKRYDIAKQYLDGAIRFVSSFADVGPERSLLDIMAYTDELARPPAPQIAPQGRPTVINLAVWGERFIRETETTFLPCCLAPGNVPALARHGTVYLRIHTRAEDVERIRALPVIQALALRAVIDIAVIPEKLLNGAHHAGKGMWNRLLFAAVQYADLMFARSIGADFLIGVADLLMANGFYGAAKRHLMGGRSVVVVQISRATSRKILEIMDQEGCRRDGCLDIAADVLYRASFAALHPVILQSFMRREPTRLPVDPIQFYVTTPEGFALHSFQLNVLAVAADAIPADLRCDFHTTDTRLLSDLLVGRDREAACYLERRMPGEMYAVSLDEEEGVASFGNFELSPRGAVDSIGKWVNRPEDVDHFLWTIRQRFEYRLPAGVTLPLPNDCRNEDETVAEMVAGLEQERPKLLDIVKGYRP